MLKILKQSDHVCWKESDKTTDVDPNPEGAGLKLQSTEELLDVLLSLS